MPARARADGDRAGLVSRQLLPFHSQVSPRTVLSPQIPPNSTISARAASYTMAASDRATGETPGETRDQPWSETVAGTVTDAHACDADPAPGVGDPPTLAAGTQDAASKSASDPTRASR